MFYCGKAAQIPNTPAQKLQNGNYGNCINTKDFDQNPLDDAIEYNRV